MCHGGGAMEKRMAEKHFQPFFSSQQGSTGVSGAMIELMTQRFQKM